MKIRNILEAIKVKEDVISFKKNAPSSYNDAVEKQNDHTHRAGAGIEPCEYCGEIGCNFDCDASQSSGFTTEARAPGLKYKEVPISKKDLSIDKVILTLKAKDSEIMTKMAKRYKELDDLNKQIEMERETMNAQVKKKMGDLFDAHDVWYTRVIETESVSMNLAKQSEATMPSVEVRVDWEKIGTELLELMEGDLLEKGKMILAKNIETVRLAGKEAKSPALRVTVKSPEEKALAAAKAANESINENVDALQAWAKKFLSWFKSWGKQYDQKLKAISAQMGAK